MEQALREYTSAELDAGRISQRAAQGFLGGEEAQRTTRGLLGREETQRRARVQDSVDNGRRIEPSQGERGVSGRELAPTQGIAFIPEIPQLGRVAAAPNPVPSAPPYSVRGAVTPSPVKKPERH